MVCVEREFPLHVIEKQPLAQVLVLEKLRIRASQPSRDVSECGRVETWFAGYRWILTRLRAPAQDGVELDIRWLGQRLREVDRTGDASLVDDHVGSVYVTMDEDGFVGDEQR